jgi:phospholipid/cholesterol/gamma-HCH transport system ATP-binding protein
MSAAPDAACGEKVIEVRELVAGYGSRRILDGVSLDVYGGEVLVIMGKSGSGKSTLLRRMLALEPSNSGCVRILGVDPGRATWRQLADLRKKIGVAFQGGALFSSMTVEQNIMLPLIERTDLDPATIRIMARIKLEAVGLTGFGDLMPGELSGGMTKRAAFARAIIMDPKILFCDEPSAGLDPPVASAIDRLVLRLRDAFRMTVVVVTHELHSAFSIADRIVVLDEGRLLFSGTPDEFRNAPSERIQDLIHRRPQTEVTDPVAYLRRLTEESDRRMAPG